MPCDCFVSPLLIVFVICCRFPTIPFVQLKRTFPFGSPHSEGCFRNLLNLICQVPPRSRLLRAGKINARTPMPFSSADASASSRAGRGAGSDLGDDGESSTENSANEHLKPAPLDPEQFSFHPLASSHRFSGHELPSEAANRLAGKDGSRNIHVKLVDTKEMQQRQQRFEDARRAAGHGPSSKPGGKAIELGVLRSTATGSAPSAASNALLTRGGGLAGFGLGLPTTGSSSGGGLSIAPGIASSSAAAPSAASFHSPAVGGTGGFGGSNRYSMAILGAPGVQSVPERSDPSVERRRGSRSHSLSRSRSHSPSHSRTGSPSRARESPVSAEPTSPDGDEKQDADVAQAEAAQDAIEPQPEAGDDHSPIDSPEVQVTVHLDQDSSKQPTASPDESDRLRSSSMERPVVFHAASPLSPTVTTSQQSIASSNPDAN
jgi:hypothetical protein